MDFFLSLWFPSLDVENTSFRIGIEPQNLVSSQQYLILKIQNGPLKTVPSCQHFHITKLFQWQFVSTKIWYHRNQPTRSDQKTKLPDRTVPTRGPPWLGRTTSWVKNILPGRRVQRPRNSRQRRWPSQLIPAIKETQKLLFRFVLVVSLG